MISIIIPSMNEPYLNKTLEDILAKAKGEIEIIVTIDENWPPEVIKDERITYLHPNKPEGMRAGINAGLKMAKGKYIMKVDAHCLFADGFDEVLVRDMKENWLMIPRRYSLHVDNWDRDLRLPIKDYHYLSWPGENSSYGKSLFPTAWPELTQQRMNDPKYMIDDTMSFQGSCWFADREYFMKHVGFLDEDKYSTFSGEQIEIGLKYWLGGGEVKVNKNTWYAHLFKNEKYYLKHGVNERNQKKSLKNLSGYKWLVRHWMNDEEPGMIHKMEWLIEKFMPIPGWPKERELWK